MLQLSVDGYGGNTGAMTLISSSAMVDCSCGPAWPTGSAAGLCPPLAAFHAWTQALTLCVN